MILCEGLTPKFLVYAPRNTVYQVLTKTMVKTDSGWFEGIVYKDVETGNVYTRTLSNFRKDEEKWEVHYS